MEERKKAKKKPQNTLERTATDGSTLVVNIYEGRRWGIHHQACSSDERVGSGASGDNMTNIQREACGHSQASILLLWLNSLHHVIMMRAGHRHLSAGLRRFWQRKWTNQSGPAGEMVLRGP